ncbi:hypothetical protein HDV63DRAFT_368500 [Trichoderma sp. SZMC 28014]
MSGWTILCAFLLAEPAKALVWRRRRNQGLDLSAMARLIMVRVNEQTVSCLAFCFVLEFLLFTEQICRSSAEKGRAGETRNGRSLQKKFSTWQSRVADMENGTSPLSKQSRRS